MGLDITLLRLPDEIIEKCKTDPAHAEYDPLDDGIETARCFEALHFLLTGSTKAKPGPLGKAFYFDAPNPLSPVIYLSGPEVREIAEALRGVTADQLRRNFDPSMMDRAPIYPSGIWGRPGQWETLVRVFNEVRTYYAKAAALGNGMAIVQY